MGPFGPRKLEIRLDKHQYRAGETVTGTVYLRLPEPVHADALLIGLYAKQRLMTTSRGRRRKPTSHHFTSDRVYDFSYPIADAGQFWEAELQFELEVPIELPRQVPTTPRGPLGDLAQIASFLMPTTRFPVQWFVYAKLKVPWRFGPRHKVQVTITGAD